MCVFSLSLVVRQTAVIQLRRSVCSLFWQSDRSQITAFVWSVWQYFCVPGRRAHCLSSLPLSPSSHHLIKEQGGIQRFLIARRLALGPSFNDETSAQGGLDICFIIIIPHRISRAAVCFRHRGDGLWGWLGTSQPSSFVIIFRLWLCSQAYNLMSWSRARLLLSALTLGYLSAPVHSDVPLNLSSLVDLWQSQSKGKERFGAGRASCKGTEKRKGKTKGKQKEKNLTKALEVDRILPQRQMFFPTLDCAQRVYLPIEADLNSFMKSSVWWQIC